MSRGALRIAVVIPAFRVEEELAGVLARIPASIDSVFVVDDASPGSIRSAVESAADPRVVLLRHETNQGVGGAMITGFRAALKAGVDIIVKCDGDGQMDPRDIPVLVRPLIDGRAEYAKGCRFHHFDELSRMPLVRLLGNIGLTFLTKLSSGYWHVLDPQNGFVAIRADVLRRIRWERLSRRFFFENDMLIRLNSIEARVCDIPFPSEYGDEPSSLRPGQILFAFPPRLVLGFFRRVLWRYVFFDVSPVAIFLFFGIPLALGGFSFGVYEWIANFRRGILTNAGTVMLAAVPLILGFQLVLQALVLDVANSPRPGPPLPGGEGND
jgi:glycosyltransferase involved in cell wall biosynthesis